MTSERALICFLENLLLNHEYFHIISKDLYHRKSWQR